MPTKRTKKPPRKPASGVVRAWIPCGGGDPLAHIRESDNGIRFVVDLLPEMRYPGCRPVGMYDPRTHRAVPITRAKKGGK